MPTREHILTTMTYKNDGLTIARRVFYTLHEGKRQTDRNSQLIARLVECLRAKDQLTDEDIDELLFQVVTS